MGFLKNKRLTTIIGILALCIIAFGFLKQSYASLQAGGRLDQAQKDLDVLKQENQELKNKLAQAGNASFVEEIFRDKLNLARPNETVIIISEEALKKAQYGEQKKVEEIKLPNWQGWLKLFKS